MLSMTHGFGALPDENRSHEEVGSSVNQLISTDKNLDSIMAMVRMSAIPVNIFKSNAA